jgi:hypothetical protein
MAQYTNEMFATIKNPRHVQNSFLGLTLKNVMKSFAVTVLVLLNTSHSTEVITELKLKRVYSRN